MPMAIESVVKTGDGDLFGGAEEGGSQQDQHGYGAKGMGDVEADVALGWDALYKDIKDLPGFGFGFAGGDVFGLAAWREEGLEGRPVFGAGFGGDE